MDSFSDEEDNRRVYLVSAALSSNEYRVYPKWFTELVPSGHLTLTLDDMLVFADRFGISEQDKWKIFDVFESPLSTLEKGEFFAFMRLIGHVVAGHEPSRELVFQQAPVPKIISDGPSKPPVDIEPVATPSLTTQSSFSDPNSQSSPNASQSEPFLSTSPASANPFRRSLDTSRSPSNAPSMERKVSGSDPQVTNDQQAFDAFTSLLLGQDTGLRKSSESNREKKSEASGSQSVSFSIDEPQSIESYPTAIEIEDDDDSSSSASNEDPTYSTEPADYTPSTPKLVIGDVSNAPVDDSPSSSDDAFKRHLSIHTVKSQHYLVMPTHTNVPDSKETGLKEPGRALGESSEKYSRRPVPPPPPPRKSGGAQANMATPVSGEIFGRRSGESPQTHNIKQAFSQNEFDAAFDEPLFNASVSSPALQSVITAPVVVAAGQESISLKGSQTINSERSGHGPRPPPPPPTRRKGHARESSLGAVSNAATTSAAIIPHTSRPPPPPPAHTLSSTQLESASAPISKLSSEILPEKNIPEDVSESFISKTDKDDAVPDLLADLSMLQEQVDRMRMQHIEDGE
ncbi:uncharacterized protein V1516DRAFT_672912 [Lipomyces oligophaga]|uniref:uncharacterized protein n=1 Tax=Lipomyces oligophaga TaxID=45792 RepID=UPI0034CEE114